MSVESPLAGRGCCTVVVMHTQQPEQPRPPGAPDVIDSPPPDITSVPPPDIQPVPPPDVFPEPRPNMPQPVPPRVP
jgi:hypothetical protein